MRYVLMTMSFVLVLASYTAAQEPNIGTASNQTTILITSIIGFLSLLATQLFALWREQRNRKWDLQDRRAARDEVRKHAQLQLQETVQTAIEMAQQQRASQQRIVEEISRNTALTQQVGAKADAAYVAANNFTERMEQLRRELRSKGEQIDHIEEVSGDTNVKVTELKEGT